MASAVQGAVPGRATAPPRRPPRAQSRGQLPAGEALAEEEKAQGHGEKRKDVVAEARLQRPSLLHAGDEEQPVERDHRGARDQGHRCPGAGQAARAPPPSVAAPPVRRGRRPRSRGCGGSGPRAGERPRAPCSRCRIGPRRSRRSRWRERPSPPRSSRSSLSAGGPCPRRPAARGASAPEARDKLLQTRPAAERRGWGGAVLAGLRAVAARVPPEARGAAGRDQEFSRRRARAVGHAPGAPRLARRARRRPLHPVRAQPAPRGRLLRPRPHRRAPRRQPHPRHPRHRPHGALLRHRHAARPPRRAGDRRPRHATSSGPATATRRGAATSGRWTTTAR